MVVDAHRPDDVWVKSGAASLRPLHSNDKSPRTSVRGLSSSFIPTSTLRLAIMTTDLQPDAPPTAPVPAAAPVVVPPAPDHRDMYILILGLVVGLAMSPWIMGRFMNEVAYHHWYFGGGKAVDEYREFLKSQGEEVRSKDDALLERLVATGVTKEAVDEMRATLFAEAEEARKPFTAAIAVERQAHEQWLRGILFALVTAVILLMFIEPLFEMTGNFAVFRRSLVTGRYALLAVWIALILGKPHAIQGISWLFLALAIAVILVAAAGRSMLAKPATAKS